MTAKRKFIMASIMNADHSGVADMEPDEQLATHVQHFIDVHLKWAKKGWRPDRDDLGFMGEAEIHAGSLSNHYMLFLPTITTNGSKE